MCIIIKKKCSVHQEKKEWGKNPLSPHKCENKPKSLVIPPPPNFVVFPFFKKKQ